MNTNENMDVSLINPTFYLLSKMSRRSKKVIEPKPVEPVNEPVNEVQPVALTKDDYNKARATIKSYREAQKNKPKRQCTEKQLAALAQGRAKNKRFANKQENK